MRNLSTLLRGLLSTGAALSTIVLGAALSTPATAQGLGTPGVVFTATNDAASNAVMAFRRDNDGRLSLQSLYPTGGAGSGGGLGNQGALTFDESGKHLFVVNPGSDTVSVFRVGPFGLNLVETQGSGGSQPISVSVSGDLVYVLHAGGGGSIAGLELAADGGLSALAGSSRPLSGMGTGPAQIAFSPDGDFLVVTEKMTNSILLYAVGNDGLTAGPVVNASEGATPFGFSFGHRSRLLVSEAAGGAPKMSTVSSYALQPDGTLKPLTEALPIMQSAACWLVTTGNGRYAYTTNTASNTVTGLGIDREGGLHLLDPDGLTAPTGAGPIDAAISRNGRFLHVLGGGDGTITTYEIQADGDLKLRDSTGGLPASANGLAAR